MVTLSLAAESAEAVKRSSAHWKAWSDSGQFQKPAVPFIEQSSSQWLPHAEGNHYEQQSMLAEVMPSARKMPM